MGRTDLFESVNWYANRLTRHKGDDRFDPNKMLGLVYMGFTVPDAKLATGGLVAILRAAVPGSRPIDLYLALTGDDDEDRSEIYLHRHSGYDFNNTTHWSTNRYDISAYPSGRPPFALRHKPFDGVDQYFRVDGGHERRVHDLYLPEGWDTTQMPDSPPPEDVLRRFLPQQTPSGVVRVSKADPSNEQPPVGFGKSPYKGEPFL